MSEYLALASRIRESLVELRVVVERVIHCYNGAVWPNQNKRDEKHRI